MRLRQLILCGGILALALPSALEGADERIRLVLRNGRRLEGRAYDLRNQYIELNQSLGSTRLPKSEIQAWGILPDEGTEGQAPNLLIVVDSGHEIAGRSTYEEDTLEWVIELPTGQARYPEERVQRTISQSGLTSDELFTPRRGFEERVASAIAEVRSGDSPRVARGREYLEQAGFFALKAVRKSIDEEGPNEVLRRLSLEERLRIVVPLGLDHTFPNLLRDATSGLPSLRVEALRTALIEIGAELYPLLGLLLLDRDQPAEVRSFAIDVLGRMHCLPELLRAYEDSEGQAQFAIAIALGDNGVYIGIPTLIEALQLPPAASRAPGARRSAQEVAIQRLREFTGESFGFEPDGTPEERAAAVELWNAWWKENRASVEDSARSAVQEGEASPRRRRAADIWRQGTLAYDRQQFESAMQLFQRAHDEDPTSAAPLISLGILSYTYRQDPQTGIDYFRQALSRPEGEGESELRRACYFHLGRIYTLGRDFDMAQKSLMKAVEIDPGYALAWFELGKVQFQEALLIGGDDTERRRDSLEIARATFLDGITALNAYRERQEILDLNALPFDVELPFSAREHNRSLRDIRQQLLNEIGRFHHEIAKICLALGETSLAKRHLAEAKEAPRPPEGLATLERVLDAAGRSDANSGE